MERKKTKQHIGGERIVILFLLPSIIGLLTFFIVPFLLSLYNALIDNPATRHFVGFANFVTVLQNGNFQMAVKNTALFTAICVPANLIVPLLLAMFLRQLKRLRNVMWLVFLLPLVIPSGSIVFFWEKTFGLNGWINALFFAQNPADLLNTHYALWIIVLIFIWKNSGYNMVLFFAGLNYIPKEYYECASIEGAGRVQTFFRITLIYLVPTIFLAFIMAFINSFKSFKDIYLLSGAYPSKSLYMLQHYLYNQFTAINYQKLASSSYIVTLAFVGIVAAMFVIQTRISRSL